MINNDNITDNTTKFTITKIKDNYYTPEIYWSDKKWSFDIGYWITWEEILETDINKLTEYLIKNYSGNLIKLKNDNYAPGWKTKEEVEVVIEYLESLMVLNKLCK